MRHLVLRVAFVVALLVAASAVPPSSAAAASESEIVWQACPLPEGALWAAVPAGPGGERG